MTQKYEKSTGLKKEELLAQVAREYQLAQTVNILATGQRASGYVEPCISISKTVHKEIP